jgi:hypothetical protein
LGVLEAFSLPHISGSLRINGRLLAVFQRLGSSGKKHERISGISITVSIMKKPAIAAGFLFQNVGS